MRFTRQRYQTGCLFKESRKAGLAVWVYRWREDTPGGRVNRKKILGNVEQLPTKLAALKAAEPFRTNTLAENTAVPVTIDHAVKHYTEHELPFKAYSTQRTTTVTLETWVSPRWGEYRLADIRAVDVESWLRGITLANSTKAKIRNVMHALFAHACRYDWMNTNPITHVRQSAKRMKVPDVLEAEELRNLIAALENPARMLVFLTAATGLRISEALGLAWSDVDFRDRAIRLNRSIVHQRIGELKTEASQKPVPMDGALAAALTEWREQTWYRQPQDWVFASPKYKGRQPYWPETLLRGSVQPTAKRVGITKKIGWHSFRRTFCDAAERQCRRREDGARTDAAREQSDDA